LGGSLQLDPLADGKWNESVFDRIIHLEYIDVSPVSYEIDIVVLTSSLPQKLLFGDSED